MHPLRSPPADHRVLSRGRDRRRRKNRGSRFTGSEKEASDAAKTYTPGQSGVVVRLGPPISAKYVTHWASTIVARVAQLSVDYNAIKLDEFHTMIPNGLCKPYFG